MEKLIESLVASGPIGLLAAASILTNIGLVVWLRSVYSDLGAIQERRVMERDAVVTALKSSADALDDMKKIVPEVTELVRFMAELSQALNVIKEMILPDLVPRKRR